MAEYTEPPRKSMASRRPKDRADSRSPAVSNDAWLNRAKQAYDASTSFVENNYRKDWEDSIRHFQNRHMQGSKYYRDSYKFRTKGFRPKTRAMVRGHEAATAAAFFSQLEIVSIEPQDKTNPVESLSADMRAHLLNYRLSDANQIPWFQTCIGAMQDGQLYGVICSKQWWENEYREETEPLVSPETGQPVLDEATGKPATVTQKIPIKDRPQVTLLPIENVRFDPAADWTDVVNSSPYVILLEPVYVGDVKERIKRGELKAVDDSVLRTARNQVYDATRQAREAEKEDKTEPRYGSELSDFDTVWLHENFMRVNGEEKHYYTLGTTARLTDPKPLEEVYFHGERPVVIGTCVIEAHRAIPDAPVHLVKGLQKEANNLSNTRQDNVQLVLNKRWIVRRGKQVDLQSLVRNAPGSVTLATDIEKDVLPIDFNDVTGSSYEEQDRINVDMDELSGTFSAGSVQSNRKLNETVGGMQMFRGSANAIVQYMITVFAETWVKKVLRQVDLLEQHYESDMRLLGLMARKSEADRVLGENFGVTWNMLQPENIEAILMQSATVQVNVANSAMDPMFRLGNLLEALGRYSEMRQIMPADIDPEAVKKEIFAFLGYRDHRRFNVDGAVALPPQIEQQMAAMQQAVEELMAENAKLKLNARAKMIETEGKLRLAHMETEADIARADEESESRIDIAERKAAADIMIKRIMADAQKKALQARAKRKAA